MKYGICMPYMERDYDRQTTLEWARAIDAGPFSSLQCGERIISWTQDMRIVLAACAALTERVRIVPSLYVLPMHQTARAAKEIATLDVLSGGRVTVTVGVGGREYDYRAVGASMERRHARMDEQIAQMQKQWRGEPHFEGVDPIGPTPVQEGGPPLLAGAMGPKSMARAARWAEGVYGFTLNGNADSAKAGFEMARQAWRDAGRDKAPELSTGFWFSLADDADTKLKTYVYEYLRVQGDAPARAVANSMTTSTPDEIHRCLDGIEELGCDEFVFSPATCELAEVERIAELIESRR